MFWNQKYVFVTEKKKSVLLRKIGVVNSNFI